MHLPHARYFSATILKHSHLGLLISTIPLHLERSFGFIQLVLLTILHYLDLFILLILMDFLNHFFSPRFIEIHKHYCPYIRTVPVRDNQASTPGHVEQNIWLLLILTYLATAANSFILLDIVTQLFYILSQKSHNQVQLLAGTSTWTKEFHLFLIIEQKDNWLPTCRISHRLSPLPKQSTVSYFYCLCCFFPLYTIGRFTFFCKVTSHTSTDKLITWGSITFVTISNWQCLLIAPLSPLNNHNKHNRWALLVCIDELIWSTFNLHSRVFVSYQDSMAQHFFSCLPITCGINGRSSGCTLLG